MATTSRARRAPLHHDPEAVRWVRERSGWTQAYTAEMLDITPAYLCEIESGKRSAPPRLLLKLADLVKCPVAILEAHRDPTAHAAALHALADLIVEHPALLTADTYLRALSLDLPRLPELPRQVVAS
ncbi:hypothetical protein GCM10010174_62010 [Kutzneria viridogrisea]|uniref:Transcriptional regulator with XRE-family HTH domain n=1 Tax=Kutzneria viridogrisea TaxID=47990 RepID=A0ABR6BG73_9PSEU|nr:transcriptional regulator with XRE-family HTH domain [Kutzneria viridogrisea]